MFTWAIMVALVLSPPAPAAVAGIPPQPPPQEQVVALPPDLRARLHAEVLAHPASRTDRLQDVVDFMFLPQGMGLVYLDEASFTVEQTYATRRGNCLAFALMFLALAEEAGMDAWPQEIDQTLAWRRLDNTLYRTSHINVGVRIGWHTYVVDTFSDAVIARNPPERIDKHRLLAHYYNNNAATLLEQGKLETALRYMDMALEEDPEFSAAWSNAGVLYMRAGDVEAAERAYETAIALDPQSSGALFNMVGLQKRKGDHAREVLFRERLERVQDEDPFHHFLQAMDCQRAGDLDCAIEHFRRSIRLHPREYRFHLALARAYRQAGDMEHADKSLARARRLSDDATLQFDPAVTGSVRPLPDRAPDG